jgi:alkylation response protein AidB-like acyl-CoA dehydrogenase
MSQAGHIQHTQPRGDIMRSSKVEGERRGGSDAPAGTGNRFTIAEVSTVESEPLIGLARQTREDHLATTVFDAMPETIATEAVERIGRLIPPRRAELDTERRFPSDLGSDAVTAGLFEQLRTRELGGCDGLTDWFRNGIRAAWWDGSFGWLISQGSAAFGMVAVGAPELAAHVYDPNRFSLAGTNAGALSLRIESERIDVNGTVPFASGCEISTGIFALGFPEREPPSSDTARYVYAPTSSWEIGRDWDVIGLRGTGSHSIAANDLQVPAADSFLVNLLPETDDPLRVLASPLGGAWCIAMSVAATQLGIARRALDETYQIAATKAPRPNPELLDDRAPVRERLMEHEASWHHAVAAAERALEGLWEIGLAGDAPTGRQRALIAMASLSANRESVKIVDGVWRIVGTSALAPQHPIARCVADIRPLIGHISSNDAVAGFAATRWRGQDPGHDIA